MTRRLRTPRRDGDDRRSAVRAREWPSRPRIGRRSPLRGLLDRPEIDVKPRGPAEEVWWARVVEAEWVRLFVGDVSVLLGGGEGSMPRIRTLKPEHRQHRTVDIMK